MHDLLARPGMHILLDRGYIGAQVNGYGYGYAMDVQSGFAVPGWPLISWPFSATDPSGLCVVALVLRISPIGPLGGDLYPVS